MNENAAAVLDTDAELAARLRMAVTRLSRRLRQKGEMGISQAHLSALSTIDRKGPMTLGELAAAERVQPPSMTRVVSRLEEGGLVERQASETDRRVARVRVTAGGRQLLRRSRTRKDAYLARRLRALEGSDRALMDEAARALELLLEGGE